MKLPKIRDREGNNVSIEAGVNLAKKAMQYSKVPTIETLRALHPEMAAPTTPAWIETYTGVAFDILAPTEEMISIDDIAHALSQMNRFTGHCRFPYPVAQHSRIGSYLVPDEHALAFLLHDASEAYCGDMNRPLKHFSAAGDAYRAVEAKLQSLIYKKFGLSEEEPKIVKDVDNMMLYAEKQQLMHSPDFKYQWSETQEAADIKIIETSFYDNKKLFLDRFFELYKY